MSPGFAVNFIVLAAACTIICGIGEGEKDGWVAKLFGWAVLVTVTVERWLP